MARFEFESIGTISDKISVQWMRNTETGQTWLRISKLYLDKNTNEMRPSKEGVSIPDDLVAPFVDLIKTL